MPTVAEIEEASGPSVSSSLVANEKVGSDILSIMFVIFFTQLLVLVALSFVMQYGPVFVVRFFFGLDYFDFYAAATEWLRNADPYIRGRLYTPPSSIAFGLLLHWAPFASARFIFFVFNVSVVFLSLHALSKQVGLSGQNKLALMGITAMFYPFYFLVERGNIDGIVLAMLVCAFRAKSTVMRSLSIGAGVAAKLYSGLVLAVMARKRQWKTVGLSALFACGAQIPFLHWEWQFLKAILGRSARFRIDENISPASLSHVLLADLGHGAWTVVYFAFWAGTLLFRVMRDPDSDLSSNWPVYIPWMISFPVLVYPYSGVLALCLIAVIASACQQRKITSAESRVMIGFGLLGFQAVAWTGYLSKLFAAAIVVHLIPAVGTAVMIVGACGLPTYGKADGEPDQPITAEPAKASRGETA